MSDPCPELPPEAFLKQDGGAEVIGQGMNAEELQANSRLSRSYGERLHRFTPQMRTVGTSGSCGCTRVVGEEVGTNTYGVDLNRLDVRL